MLYELGIPKDWDSPQLLPPVSVVQGCCAYEPCTPLLKGISIYPGEGGGRVCCDRWTSFVGLVGV